MNQLSYWEESIGFSRGSAAQTVMPQDSPGDGVCNGGADSGSLGWTGILLSWQASG